MLEDDTDTNLLPTKYQGLPSDVIEELWQPKVYADPAKTESERNKRENALAQLRREEEAGATEDAKEANRIRASLLDHAVPAANEKAEKEKQLQEEMLKLLQSSWVLAETRGLTFDQFLKKGCLAASMYEMIHTQNCPPHKEMYEKYYSNPQYQDFDARISKELIDQLSQISKVRHITPDELRKGGQPDQAEGFVWFKGNANKPKDAREIRFYVNVKPEGVLQAAKCVGQISDYCDRYGMRLQFKFRKQLDTYDRSDTCVAYLYLPPATSPDEQQKSDAWVERVAQGFAQIPNGALRKNVSLFSNQVKDGIGYVEDARRAESKKGESYTSQITNTMGKIGLEWGKNPVDGDVDQLLKDIVNESMTRLKQVGYAQ